MSDFGGWAKRVRWWDRIRAMWNRSTSLDEWNADQRAAGTDRVAPATCPKCGRWMVYVGDTVFLSNPATVSVGCRGCGYVGSMIYDG